MTLRTPNDDTLLGYATGTLAAAPALVVETHLAFAPQSRRRVRDMEEIGGRIVDGLPPAPLDADALAKALARIELPLPPNPAAASEPDLPEPLRHCSFGPWTWAGRGTQIRRVLVPGEGDWRVLMFRIDPGRKMPQHTHTGMEFTCVISGSYSDVTGRYGPGDFEEADDELSHRPVVDSDVPCVCLVALEGEVRLEGLVGRLLQPFVRL